MSFHPRRLALNLPPQSERARPSRGAVAAILIAASTGVCLWMAFGAGPRPARLSPIAIGGVVVAVAFVTPGTLRPAWAGAAFVAGPLVLAGATASRGDRDGLWTLIFLVLVGLGALSAATSEFTARMWRRWRPEADAPRRAFSGAALSAGAVLAIACAVIAVISWWPRPWRSLTNAVAAFVPPPGARLVGLERDGDPLCSASCSITIVRHYALDGPAGDCAPVEQAVTRFTGQIEERTQQCHVAGRRRGGPVGYIVAIADFRAGNLDVSFGATCRGGDLAPNRCG